MATRPRAGWSARWKAPVAELRVPRRPSLRGALILADLVACRRRGYEAVAARQLVAVREMVRHAAVHVPAYQEIFSAADADRLQSLDDLATLPIVDKRTFLGRAPADRAWSPPGITPRVNSTSGTSGEPLSVPWAPGASWRNGLQRMLMMADMRIRPWDDQVAVVPQQRVRSLATRRVGWTSALAGQRLALSETEPVEEVAAELIRLRPDWVTAEAHTLVALGEALGGRLRPRTVTSYGVALDAVMRREIEAEYGTRVLDIYGASETGQMAWQCRKADLYHVNHEIVLIEVVDSAGRSLPPGEPGDLVLTGLLNPLLPVIRYRIGDGGAWADRPCACGHRLPALTAIAGRTFDWLVDGRGERVAPQRLWLSALIGDRIDDVQRYRMAQGPSGAVLVEIVPSDPRFAADGPDLVRAAVQRVVGAGTAVEVRLVDAIVTPPGRRFRQFTSERQPGRS